MTDPIAWVPAGIAIRPSTRRSRVTRASTRSSTRAVSLFSDDSSCRPMTDSAGTVSSSQTFWGSARGSSRGGSTGTGMEAGGPAAGLADWGTSTTGAGICGAGTPPRSDWAWGDEGALACGCRAVLGRAGALPESTAFRGALPTAGGSSGEDDGRGRRGCLRRGGRRLHGQSPRGRRRATVLRRRKGRIVAGVLQGGDIRTAARGDDARGSDESESKWPGKHGELLTDVERSNCRAPPGTRILADLGQCHEPSRAPPPPGCRPQGSTPRESFRGGALSDLQI